MDSAKPPVPDSYSIPHHVNEWIHRPDSSFNGHVWKPCSENKSVCLRLLFGEVFGAVRDERASGSETRKEIFRFSFNEHEDIKINHRRKEQATVKGIRKAVSWMEENDPEEWKHPNINESVFDPPPGYELSNYSIEKREITVRYLREGKEEKGRVAGARIPEKVDPETYPYLVVSVWRGSGNSSISLAHAARAHDSERIEVIEPEEGCGLDIALAMTRDWARKNVEEEKRTSTHSGQTTFNSF